MKIDWDWKNEPHKKARKWLRWLKSKPVPNCHSDHYIREHFYPDLNEPPTLF